MIGEVWTQNVGLDDVGLERSSPGVRRSSRASAAAGSRSDVDSPR